jgi:hypothetical protein
MKQKSRKKKDAPPTGAIAGKYIDYILLGFLGLVILYVFRGSVLLGKTAAAPDTVAQAAVFGKFALRELFENHRYPLWFPDIMCGMPFFASMTWIEVYPPAVLIRLIGHYLPLPYFSNPLHFLLGGVGMYFVARHFCLGRAASLITSCSFVLSTGIITMEHGTRIITAMYLPLIFLLVKRALEERRIDLMLWASVAAGFQILANHIQIVFYTWLLIALYVLYYWLIPALFKKPSMDLVKAISRVVAIGVLAAVIGGVLLINLQEYTPHSARSFGVGTAEGYEYATSWSFPPFEVLEFLLPSIAGFSSPTYWGSMPFTHAPYYMGAIVLILVSCALVYRRNRDVWFLVLVAAATILLSFGKNFGSLYGVFYEYVPFFNRFRIPVLILLVAVFSIALLAGFGMESLLQAKSDKKSKGRKGSERQRPIVLIVVWIVVAIIIPSYLTVAREDFVDTAAHPVSDQGISVTQLGNIKAARHEMAVNDSWRSFGFILAAGVAVLLLLRGMVGRTVFAGLIVVLIVVDLVLIAGRVIKPEYPRASIEEYYQREEQTELVQFLLSDSTLFRILPLGREMSTNKYAYFGIQSVAGYHAVKMGLYDRMTRELGFPRNLKLLHMMNAKYVIAPSEIRLPTFRQVLSSRQGFVYENLEVLPRFFTVDSAAAFRDLDLCLLEMKKPSFDPARYAVVVSDTPISLEPGATAGLTVHTYDIHRIEVEAIADGRCLLVMSETYYPPGWRMYVDGVETDILHVNYLFRGLVLEPGTHTVVLEYNATLFRAGLSATVLSLLAIGACLGGTAVVRRRRRSI